MARKNYFTVKDLAEEACVDLDEALISLWDSGIDYVTDPNHQIKWADAKRARRSLCLPTLRELTSIEYWQNTLDLHGEELNRLLLDLGFRISPNARTLPQGALRKLRIELRKRALQHPVLNIEPAEIGTEIIKEEIKWMIIGHKRDLRMLTYEEVLNIHYALVEDFAKHEDPIDPPGVKSESLLHSAVFRPQTAIGDQPKYPTVEMAAAALLHSLVHDHPFHNGNKRTALVAMLVFLDNKKNLADAEALSIAEWICSNCRSIEHGERPVPFRKLKQILNRFGCTMEFGTTGSKVNIERKIKNSSFLGKTQQEILKTQVSYEGAGREVRKNTIHKIRSDLRLDEEHGVDSIVFYGKSSTDIDEFITAYRKTLRRLAKL